MLCHWQQSLRTCFGVPTHDRWHVKQPSSPPPSPLQGPLQPSGPVRPPDCLVSPDVHPVEPFVGRGAFLEGLWGGLREHRIVVVTGAPGMPL